jgi:hypothetical protein
MLQNCGLKCGKCEKKCFPVKYNPISELMWLVAANIVFVIGVILLKLKGY